MKIILGKARPLSGRFAKAHPQVLIIAPDEGDPWISMEYVGSDAETALRDYATRHREPSTSSPK